jgi:hypothetical protein
MPRPFGRHQHQDESSDPGGSDIPVNEHLFEKAVDLLDGLGWAVYELCRQTEDEADKEDRMQFLTEWRYLRRALTLNHPCEFNFYDSAHEWHTNIRYIFRDGLALHHSDTENSFEAYQAEERSYAEFLAAYDPDEDPYS